MRHVVAVASQLTIAIAAMVAVVAVARAVLSPRAAGAALGSGLGLTLEFLLAAGLLRLAARPGLATLGVAALIIAVRQVIGAGLRYGRVALSRPAELSR